MRVLNCSTIIAAGHCAGRLTWEGQGALATDDVGIRDRLWLEKQKPEPLALHQRSYGQLAERKA